MGELINSNTFADNTENSKDREDWLLRRNRYWMRLRAVHREFNALKGGNYSAGDELFVKYLQDTYGVQMHVENTHITALYNVVDKSKYLLFLMKFDV